MQIAELGTVVAGIFGVGFLIWGAYQTYRKGLKLSATNTLTGAPATAAAVVMLVAAVVVAVVVVLLWIGKIHF
jgi:hypothetical protein